MAVMAPFGAKRRQQAPALRFLGSSAMCFGVEQAGKFAKERPKKQILETLKSTLRRKWPSGDRGYG